MQAEGLDLEVHLMKKRGDWYYASCGFFKKVRSLRKPFTDMVTVDKHLVTCDACVRQEFGEEDWEYIEWKIRMNVDDGRE